MDVSDIINMVRSYVNRDPSDMSDDVIMTFLNNVNGKLNRSLNQHPKMLVRAEAILAANSNLLSFPTDLVQIKALHSKIDGKLSYYEQFYITGPYPYEMMKSKCFVDRGNAFEVFPTSTEDTTFVMDYYRSYGPFTSPDGHNFIVQYHPDIYLYGALVESAVWVKDQESFQRWQSEFETRLATLVASGWAGHHITSPVIRYNHKG